MSDNGDMKHEPLLFVPRSNVMVKVEVKVKVSVKIRSKNTEIAVEVGENDDL